MCTCGVASKKYLLYYTLYVDVLLDFVYLHTRQDNDQRKGEKNTWVIWRIMFTKVKNREDKTHFSF